MALDASFWDGQVARFIAHKQHYADYDEWNAAVVKQGSSSGLGMPADTSSDRWALKLGADDAVAWRGAIANGVANGWSHVAFSSGPTGDPPSGPWGDDFNRANSANLGADWTGPGWSLNSNTALSTTTANQITVNDRTFSDVTVEADILSGSRPDFCQLVARSNGGSSYYTASIRNTGQVIAYRRVVGTYTAVATWAGPWPLNGRLGLRCAGTTISVLVNGTVVASGTDSTYSSGLVGMGSGSVAARFDNFYADGYGAPATTGPPRIGVDGTDATTSVSGPSGSRIGNGSQPMFLGYHGYYTARSWRGLLSCVSFTDTALSDTRIAAHKAAAASGAAAYKAAVLADNPYGFWPMNETAGTIYDISGNANHSSAIIGTPLYSQWGPISGAPAISFDGNAGFRIPDKDQWSASGFTLEAFIRPWTTELPRRGGWSVGMVRGRRG